MPNETVELKDIRLTDLIKAFKGTLPKTRVGVLQDKDARTNSKTATNAKIGARHEYGEEGMPVRSFLRMPISQQLQKHLDQEGAFDKDAIENIIKTKSLFDLMKMIGITAEGIVAEAFDTGGWGQWKPSNMENKKVHMTLVETQQLRNSIGSEVV